MEEPQPIEATPEEQPAPRRPWRRRLTLRLLAVPLALLAAILVSVLTVDLGPSLRELAEREGSKYLERPMHIGRLSARLTPGVFVIEDLVIEGLTPDDRPWLQAKRIVVEVPWWTAFSRHLTIESISMDQWEMVVETFPGDIHNFPRLTRPAREPRDPAEPGRFRTTLKSVVASRGTFTFEDHGTPWSAVARNLHVAVHRGPDTYLGRASFSDGTIDIQDYVPFGADMQARFHIDGSLVKLDRIDLVSDGAKTVATGEVNLGRWPEQVYHVTSRIDFPTQKDIFFANDNFAAHGVGDFTGSFRLFRGGRELKGAFRSDVAGVNDWRFPRLRGNVLWVPDRLEITDAVSEFHGGTARFAYRMGPFGAPTPANAVWDVEYSEVSLASLTDFLETEGIRLDGRISGRNRLEWPLGPQGGWARRRGGGEAAATPPAGVRTMTRGLPDELVASLAELPPRVGPFNPREPLGYVPVAGRVTYRVDPEWIVIDRGWAASPMTYVEFEGRTAYAERSRIPFHVTSLDWQESDRLLAGIMTAFGADTSAIAIGGYGEFDGVMLGAFTDPRIEGRFEGYRMRAWDVLWDRATADLVVEDAYVTVTQAVVTADGGSEIHAEGRFSLGYPRRDGGEEINARVRLNRRPLRDLRDAFGLEDYPVDGFVSGEYHVYGQYEAPHGFGRLVIEDGVAYGETFDVATSALRFEGNGVRLNSLEIGKAGGNVTGAAWVAWDGSYSFNADGRRIPVESLQTLYVPQAPLSGLLQFTAAGTGTFEVPRYEVKGRVDDLFAGDEGVGQVTTRLNVFGEVLTLEIEAASPRLVVSGSGRIALTDAMDTELSFRFADTSLDPYVRFFEPRLSPFTTAVASGTVRAVGELANLDHLVVNTRVELLDMKLFDYRLRNEGPIELALERNVVNVGRLRLVGDGTQLDLNGEVSLATQRLALLAAGDANLGILQGFFRDLRSSGAASLTAEISGPLAKPIIAGQAEIANGRVRHFSLPHSLESMNGRLSFDSAGVRLDDVTAKLGGGDVRLGGRIGLTGIVPGDLNLTMSGEQMRIRYPEGFRSLIDAELALRGDFLAPVLTGTVTVRDALWSRRFEATPDILALTGARGAAPVSAPATGDIPVRFDVQILAPSSLRIENNIAHITSSADLRLQGTYDRPLLFGRAQIDRGDIVFEGNRYLVTRGSIDFFNPQRIEPFFDIEAETRVRVPAQTYRVTLGVNGTTSRISFSLSSDPPLPEIDIVALLFGQDPDVANAELRAITAGQSSEQALLAAATARLLASPIATPVGRVFEQTLGIDTVQISPTFGGVGTEADPLALSAARLLIGKRLSARAYVTYARALGAANQNQIILLEYDQNERLSWVLTQTGDNTFAVDFRVRHTF